MRPLFVAAVFGPADADAVTEAERALVAADAAVLAARLIVLEALEVIAPAYA